MSLTPFSPHPKFSLSTGILNIPCFFNNSIDRSKKQVTLSLLERDTGVPEDLPPECTTHLRSQSKKMQESELSIDGQKEKVEKGKKRVGEEVTEGRKKRKKTEVGEEDDSGIEASRESDSEVEASVSDNKISKTLSD